MGIALGEKVAPLFCVACFRELPGSYNMTSASMPHCSATGGIISKSGPICSQSLIRDIIFHADFERVILNCGIVAIEIGSATQNLHEQVHAASKLRGRV